MSTPTPATPPSPGASNLQTHQPVRVPAASGHVSDRNKQSMVKDLYRPLRFLLHRRRAGKIGNLPPALREHIKT